LPVNQSRFILYNSSRTYSPPSEVVSAQWCPLIRRWTGQQW